MKLRIISTIIIAMITYNQASFAGTYTIPKTYTTGDTLTAADLNNENTAIKAAVDDNDSRIIAMFAGDGSAGDLTISTSTNWNTSPPSNPYFNNVTINSGQTLTVPAGTTIRCSGSFVNNGTIAVSTGARGEGTNYSAASPASSGPQASAHPGDASSSATIGAFHDNAVANPVTTNGGEGGVAIPESVARLSFSQFRIGGGSGAGAVDGGHGGGLVKIYCAGDIINNGTINANGNNGSGGVGGGGGGIVILASATLVNNTLGTINTIGGNGGNDSTLFGASGGGGGGIVIMISPASPIQGTTNVTGGTGATGGQTQTSTAQFAGCGGGASGGNGGNGGSTSSSRLNSAGSNGNIGYIITMNVDPTIMAR